MKKKSIKATSLLYNEEFDVCVNSSGESLLCTRCFFFFTLKVDEINKSVVVVVVTELNINLDQAKLCEFVCLLLLTL